MEEAEPSHYVAQLKAEFDSCDTTSTGFLDREAVTALCRKLQLDAHLPLLLDSLLGGGSTYARVNFEEFKDNFVDVLSRSLDVSTSEDDSSYLEPVVPDEVKPKFVKGEKRYGRRSRPDARPDAALSCHSDISPPSDAQNADSSPSGVRRPKVRRSTSLDSVESLKSDGEPGSPKDVTQISFQSKGQDEPLAPAAQDLEHGVGLREFRNILCCSGPVSCSTPLRRMPQAAFEERSPRSTSPSLLTATLGPRVLSQLDDGSGCASPERVVALWTEEGIRNSRDILQTLDFPLEERLSLAELTLALDNELLVSGNGIHQAALISYRNEIQHLQGAAEQACKERDKAKVDLDLADRRNLQLVREVDDRHASMETLNHSRIRDLEQDFRDRLAVLRSQAEQESDAMLQQLERERGMLREELRLLKVQEAGLQEELDIATQENRRLEEELADVKRRLTEVESSAERLQKDLEQLLHDKFGSLDTAAAGPNPEERLCELIKEYEQRCRELQDKNDELNSELELLKCQRNDRKSGRPTAHKTPAATLSWNEPHCVSEPDSDDSEMKRRSSPPHQSKMDPADTTVSIHTELAVEQLKQKHNQEVQQLNIQLETQVNYYERTLDRIRQSMEVERKDIAQAFKLEINELEEQKTEAEQQARQLKEALDKLQNQIQHGGWSSEQERRVQRERADLEQNFAREIGNLVQKLSAEKDQLEAELKLKMDQEVSRVRTRLEEVVSDNSALHERVSVLQQEVEKLEDDVASKRSKLEEMQHKDERSRQEEARLQEENSGYRQEVLSLSSRNLQLSTDNGELSARLRAEQESLRALQERLDAVSRQQEEGEATLRHVQEEAEQQQAAWRQERLQLEEELTSCRRKLSQLEAELSVAADRQQKMEAELSMKVEKLQKEVLSLQQEAERLRSQLHAITQENLGHAQEVSALRRKLQDAQRKTEEVEAGARKLMMEEEQEKQRQHLQQQTVQQLIQDQQSLKSQLKQMSLAKMQAEGQADAALTLVQQQQEGVWHRERAEQLLAQLQEEQRRSRQLEEELKLQVEHSSSHVSLKQEQYEKAMVALQLRTEELESKLKGVRTVLQEKVQQLKEQMAKNVKSSVMLKDLYVENSQLMKALQVTEQHQKNAEKKNFQLEEKVSALNKLLREIVPASLAT
ncbi:ninein-like protein isoform X2 [Dunckerocampus dactyliophorus]|uniref:ninein-like protein isoform X2 n=1 Tax=Dunckerocampus dactyliophorus TaxID=161453 RepID=UPI002406BEFA|nr:ninein-like protein isoform X2 [Dunckerocampus dactyliophorus]